MRGCSSPTPCPRLTRERAALAAALRQEVGHPGTAPRCITCLPACLLAHPAAAPAGINFGMDEADRGPSLTEALAQRNGVFKVSVRPAQLEQPLAACL